jgi:hypothetical protein
MGTLAGVSMCHEDKIRQMVEHLISLVCLDVLPKKIG